MGADDAIKDKKNALLGHVDEFAGETPEFFPRVRVAGVPHRVVILAGNMIDEAHSTEVPQITGPVPIFTAPYGVPVAGRIHALPAVVGSRQ